MCWKAERNMLGLVLTSVFAPYLLLLWICWVQFFSSSASTLVKCSGARVHVWVYVCVCLWVCMYEYTQAHVYIPSFLLIDTHIYLYTWRWWKVWFSRCQKQSCFDMESWMAVWAHGGIYPPVHPESSIRQSLCVTQHSHGATLIQTGKPYSNPSSVMTLLPSWRILCTQKTRRIRNCC